MRCMFALGLALVLPGFAVAEDIWGEKLYFFLAKSDVVALGEFTSEPVVKEATEEIRHYQADFKITQVIKWVRPSRAVSFSMPRNGCRS